MKRLSAILVALLAVYALADDVGKPIPTDPGLMRAEIVKLRAQVASLEKQLASAKGATTQKVATSQPAKGLFAINTPTRGWEARARRASAPQEMVIRAQKHDEAIRKLLADGEITQEQADALLDGKPLVGMTRSHIVLIGRVSLLDRNADASVMIHKLQVYSVTEIGHEYQQHPAAIYNLRVESGKISVIERKK